MTLLDMLDEKNNIRKLPVALFSILTNKFVKVGVNFLKMIDVHFVPVGYKDASAETATIACAFLIVAHVPCLVQKSLIIITLIFFQNIFKNCILKHILFAGKA